MALPCFCYRCAIYISQESLTDEECLAVEEKNICKKNDCDNCSYECLRFTTDLPIKEGKIINLV